MKSLGETIASDIKATEVGIKAKLDALRKTHELLKLAAGRIGKKPWPFGDTRKLLNDLASHAAGGLKDDVQQLQERLKKQLDDAANTYEQSFMDEIVAEARKIDVSTGTFSGTHFLGPFRLTLDFAHETGVLVYADLPIAPPIILDAENLVAEAHKSAETLILAPVDVAKLASDLEEAIRVALTRNRKLTEARELRCPLPELHREMTLLRQDRSRAVTSKSFRDYPMARFVVELKTLIQSEQNVNSSQRFRLEPAVIENTKNPKKSVFVPKDIHKGFGEGTYFQAIVLVNEAP